VSAGYRPPWIAVPPRSGPAWAVGAAEAVWERSGVAARAGEPGALAVALACAAERFAAVRPGFALFLHLPGPREPLLPVWAGGVECAGDPREAVRWWAGADDPGAVEPPVVEEFASAALGAGVRVLRYAVDPGDPSGSLTVGLRYVWHVPAGSGPGALACLFAVSPDPARLLAARGDLDAFARALPTPAGAP